MCGITGILPFNLAGRIHTINLARATDLLKHRGPDESGTFVTENVGLGHRRLSIIDLSKKGKQPMTDHSGRFTIVYNGEIYNYRELKKNLLGQGVRFVSETDTEVLLYAYIHEKENCLEKLNGFFAFAIYDAQENSLFLARDRFGIKPLYYHLDEDKFIFASELHSVLAYGLEKSLDSQALYAYLQLNYIPAPITMVEQVNALEPGHWMKVKDRQLTSQPFYNIHYDRDESRNNALSYQQQQTKLRHLVEKSVQKRLVADVPVGTFLSGGIDSTIISGVARQYKEGLQTFSIGYADEPFFDETRYAEDAARKFNTKHTVFSLTNQDLHDHLFQVLDQFDQPFADSSAIPTFILSKRTAREVKVALSGDGADELFSGYNKHAAAHRAMRRNLVNQLIAFFGPVWENAPKSRNSRLANKFRQLQKYSDGLNLSQRDRYWRWASIMKEDQALDLLHPSIRQSARPDGFNNLKNHYLSSIATEDDFNEILLTDMRLVLPNDMLKKVDLMSMGNGLEVRVPFLDHEVVDYVFGLPVSSKIDQAMRKKILQDAFRDMLPAEIYRRPKQGFEVPLLKWFSTSLRGLIVDDLLADRFVEEQEIFDLTSVKKLKKRLFSRNPGDAVATVWALIVFQWWWKKTMK